VRTVNYKPTGWVKISWKNGSIFNGKQHSKERGMQEDVKESPQQVANQRPYLAWLEEAKKTRPNEPSEVYKYWYLAYQKTEDSEEASKLINSFQLKKLVIELAGGAMAEDIREKMVQKGQVDDSMIKLIKIWSCQFLIGIVFEEEKTKLETLPLESILSMNEMFDRKKYETYLRQEKFQVNFLELAMKKFKGEWNKDTLDFWPPEAPDANTRLNISR
jgi:hypothetical protein